jgi:predicted glycosyltransferase
MRIWVDCTAAPHPLVLRPIVERMRGAGHEVSITARDYGQTLGVLDRLGLDHEVFGRHGGGSIPGKARALAARSASLARWARARRFDLALAHGSVDLALVSTALRVPSVQMQDYEHAGLQRQLAFRAARRVLVPDAIPVSALRRAGAAARKVFRYPGLKEDYYLADFRPDPAVLDDLGIERQRVLAVVRPPPETSAYHTGNPLYAGVIERLGAEPATVAVIIPRTEAQGETLRARSDPSLLVPEHAIDAQSLIAFADLVVSAGGTMNREAAALGAPVYTIFSGRMGAVDERLIAEGRLRRLDRPDQFELAKREPSHGPLQPRDPGMLTAAVLEAAANARIASPTGC